MSRMPARLATLAVLALALAATVAAPAAADGCTSDCQSSCPEGSTCTTSGSDPAPASPSADQQVCRPVEFTGGQPRLQLYPVLNVIAINWCLVNGVTTSIGIP